MIEIWLKIYVVDDKNYNIVNQSYQINSTRNDKWC